MAKHQQTVQTKQRPHNGAPFWYTACRNNPCTCGNIAAADPGMTFAKNRAETEKYHGPLPSDEQIIKNYEARYANA